MLTIYTNDGEVKAPETYFPNLKDPKIDAPSEYVQVIIDIEKFYNDLPKKFQKKFGLMESYHGKKNIVLINWMNQFKEQYGDDMGTLLNINNAAELLNATNAMDICSIILAEYISKNDINILHKKFT